MPATTDRVHAHATLAIYRRLWQRATRDVRDLIDITPQRRQRLLENLAQRIFDQGYLDDAFRDTLDAATQAVAIVAAGSAPRDSSVCPQEVRDSLSLILHAADGAIMRGDTFGRAADLERDATWLAHYACEIALAAAASLQRGHDLSCQG